MNDNRDTSPNTPPDDALMRLAGLAEAGIAGERPAGAQQILQRVEVGMPLAGGGGLGVASPKATERFRHGMLLMLGGRQSAPLAMLRCPCGRIAAEGPPGRGERGPGNGTGRSGLSTH